MSDQLLKNLLNAKAGEGQIRLAHEAAPLLVRAPGTPDLLVQALLQTQQRPAALLVLAQCLDSARMAQENAQTGGAAFLAAVTNQLSIAKRRGELPADLLPALAACYARAGLDTPEAFLVPFKSPGLDTHSSNPRRGPVRNDRVDPGADPGAALDAAIDQMVKSEDATAVQLHAMLAELLAALPPPVRSMMVHRIASRPGAPFDRLASYWLLDPAAETRRAAAQALTDRMRQGLLPPGLVDDASRLIAWLPEARERDAVAAIIAGAGTTNRAASKAGRGSAADRVQKPWRVDDVLMSMPDGAGCQNVTLMADRGRERAVAVCLLKRGQGIKDAFVMPCGSKVEQRRLMGEIGAEIPMLPVSLDFARIALGWALMDGLDAGALPGPGLLDVINITGDLQVLPTDATAILASLDPATKALVATKSDVKRLAGRQSDVLWTETLFDSWFEQTENLDKQLEAATTGAAATTAVWAALEDRRVWWAQQLALAAALADATPVLTPFASGCMAAAATSLLDKGPIKSLSVMKAVVDATLEAFAGRATEQLGSGFHAGGSRNDLAAAQLGPVLAAAGLPIAFLHGWGTALAAAPVAPTPTNAMSGLFNRLAGIPVASFDVLLGFISDTLEDAADAGADSDALSLRLRAHTASESAQWCDGFTSMVAAAKRCWPRSRLGPDGQTLLKCIASGAKNGLAREDRERVGHLIPLLIARAG